MSNSLSIFLLGVFNPTEKLTGPEKVAKRLFSHYSQKDLDVIFVEYFSDGTKYNLWDKLFGFEIAYNEFGKEILKLGVFRLAITLWTRKPRIIHILNFDRFPLVAFLFRSLLNYKVYITVHGITSYEMGIAKKNIWSYYNLKDKVAELLYYKLCDKLFFLSKESLEIASRYNNIRLSKVNLIANGIDREFRSTFLSRLNVSGTSLKLVFIGDFNRTEKGLRFLLDGLSKINFCVELFIIGSGYKSSLLSSNEEVKINLVDKMQTAQLASFYEDKDIFLSTSFYETFSLAVVEAMAAGLVPVITKETGMSRFIESGKNGFVFDYGNLESMCKILRTLSNDKDLLKQISYKTSAIYNSLNWEIVSHDYLKLYGLRLNE